MKVFQSIITGAIFLCTFLHPQESLIALAEGTDTDTDAVGDDDIQITNDEESLIVGIDRPIQIDLYQTSQNLSDDAINAFLGVVNNFATVRMNAYFVTNYGTNEYIFDTVSFELVNEIVKLEKVPIIGGRNLRVFEREEEHSFEAYQAQSLKEDQDAAATGSDGDIPQTFQRGKDVVQIQSTDRDLQGKIYGTRFTLGGNFTFAGLPAAPSSECNRKLQKHMAKTTALANAIKAINHDELNPLNNGAIEVTILPLPTAAPTTSPTKVPTKTPTKAPTASPTKAPTVSPTRVPTKAPIGTPIEAPTKAPTKQPVITPVFETNAPIAPTTKIPTKAPTISTVPKSITDPEAEEDSSLLPIIIPVAASAMILAGSALFLIKRKYSQKRTMYAKPRLLAQHEKMGDEEDGDFYDAEGGIMVREVSTKDLDSGGSGESESILLESFDSELSQSKDGNGDGNGNANGNNTNISMAAVETPITSNRTGRELISPNATLGRMKSKLDSASKKLPEEEPLTSGNNVIFPVKLNDSDHSSASSSLFSNKGSPSSRGSSKQQQQQQHEDSPKSTSAEKDLVAKAVVTAGSKSPFQKMKKENATPTPSPKAKDRSMIRKKISSSPVTNITPTKVSKEEFEKEWDVDLPFNWKPTTPSKSPMSKSSKKKKNKKKSSPRAESVDNDIEGSFPTFDMDDEPPIPPPMQNDSAFGSSRSQATSMQSTNDSLANRSMNDLHPLDWSRKGSDHDGDSTLTGTDGDSRSRSRSLGRGQFPLNVSANSSPATFLNGSGDYMTPRSELTAYDSSPQTFATSISRSPQSSPASSRGSSKQLINDIVWLEKKIADVRARVDRLDDDESETSGSPPMSPSSPVAGAGSPIAAKIICRDVVAPAGRLQIVIHSTKDGPAIHSVKPGSVVENQLFSGDLIVSVNDNDTRELNAEEVMEMMARYSSSERKLTVLHHAS